MNSQGFGGTFSDNDSADEKYWQHSNIVQLFQNNDDKVEFQLIAKFKDRLNRFVNIISKNEFAFISHKITRQAIDQVIKDIKAGSPGIDYEQSIFDTAVALVIENGNLKDFATIAERLQFLNNAYIKAKVLDEIDNNPLAFGLTSEDFGAYSVIGWQQTAIKRLQEENKSLEARLKQQRDFIAKIVHEARSHMRFISFNLDMLFKFDYTPDRESEFGSLLYTIKESAQQHKNLLHNLTDFSANEYGSKIITKLETIAVYGYLNNILAEYRTFSEGLGYPLDIQFVEPEFRALLDVIKFRQVVHNLIINATQHGEKGMIKVAVSTDPLTNTWSLVISNPILPYSQTESYRNGHLGLGLKICKESIETMKGKIEVNSMEDIFTVKILMPL